MNTNIKNFWLYTAKHLQTFQNYQNIVPEFLRFLAKYPLTNPNDDDLTAHPEFANFSEPTRLFLTAHTLLKRVNPGLTMLLNREFIHLPQLVAEKVLRNKELEIERDGGVYPDKSQFKPVPVIIRYDLTISIGDPLLLDLVEEVYQAYKLLVTKKQIEIPIDWTILKYRPKASQQPQPFAFNDVILTDQGNQVNYILQKYKKDEPLSINNPIELIFKINKSLPILKQEDIEEFRQQILIYIDALIGDYKAFVYIRSISMIPDEVFDQYQQKFPEHYKLEDWDNFTESIKIVPQSEKCKLCLCTEDNTDMINIIEDTGSELIEPGVYCKFCFKLLARTINIEN